MAWTARANEFPEAVGKYSLDQYRAALQEVLAPYAANEPTRAPLYLYLAMQTVHLPLESRLAEGATGAAKGSVTTGALSTAPC